MNKHTAGPWSWNDDENTIHRADGIKIAAAYDLRDDADGDVAEANAALIASAPDLLAALEETIAAAQIQLEGHGKGIKPSDRLSAAFNAGLAAIAKAKGQQ